MFVITPPPSPNRTFRQNRPRRIYFKILGFKNYTLRHHDYD